jgi:hypothetical protein
VLILATVSTPDLAANTARVFHLLQGHARPGTITKCVQSFVILGFSTPGNVQKLYIMKTTSVPVAEFIASLIRLLHAHLQNPTSDQQ